MEVLIRSRRPVRKEFEILHKELELLLSEQPLKVDEINVKFKLFQDNYDTLQHHDSKVVDQLMKEELSDEDVDKEFLEIRGFKVLAESLRLAKEKKLPAKPLSTESLNDGGSIMESKIRNFKLPTVQMKKFSGQLKDWLAFWAQFQKIDEDPHMHGSDKFWYLVQALEPGTDAFEIAAGYPQSNENYPKVIEALKKQYGNVDLLLQVYLRELLNLVISNVSNKNKIPMKTLFLKLDSHLRALKSLNLEKADPATWLFPLVESSLPENVLYNWQRSPLSSRDGQQETPPKTRLDFLMDFVAKEVEIKQRIDITRSFVSDGRTTSQATKTPQREQRNEKISTLSSFHVADKEKCIFCKLSNHESQNCFKAKKLSYNEIMDVLKRKGGRFKCCGSHLKKDCNSKTDCSVCKTNHHSTILCRNKNKPRNVVLEDSPPAKRSRTDIPLQTTSSSSNTECTRDVALQTLKVKILGYGKDATVRAFIDTGSQRSYILQSTATNLNMIPVGEEQVVHSLFGGKTTDAVTHRKYRINIQSMINKFQQYVEVRENKKLCCGIPNIENNSFINEELNRHGIQLSDQGLGNSPIELLIGADLYPNLLTGEIVKLSTGAVAINTKLGWSLLGRVDNLASEESMASLSLSLSVVDASITQLWNLEVLGIRDVPTTETEQERNAILMTNFRNKIRRQEDGRYCVQLPWKTNDVSLPSNYEVAKNRLEVATQKLIQSRMFDVYDKIFKDWETEGFIEKVSKSSTTEHKHYVPHRPVIKMESLTTPVRPVFDASCRVRKSPSLNDCLYTGENLVKLIPEILIRFRKKAVGFVSDIRKAFQMISVEEPDRDMMRFLWWESIEMDKVVEYRHARVMFGATCSPFILAAVLHHHLLSVPEEDREVAEKLLSTLYVDNSVSSEDSVEEYHDFRRTAVKLLENAKMDLRQWFSSVDEFDNPSTNVISVLGLEWDRMKDELYVNLNKFSVPEKATKRIVLSTIQKIFDPLGILSPAFVPMKKILQRAWINKRKWDEELPENEAASFLKWCREAKQLSNIRIPRRLSLFTTSREEWSLHTFADASKDSYSAATFLRDAQSSGVQVQLVCAKSRLAPVKAMTIPKLELMGCVLAARLSSFVKSSLEMEELQEFYWTDSSTALAWIGRKYQWGTFVDNRVTEIGKLAKIDQWRHVPGEKNPADLPSRGCFPVHLNKTKWWDGPLWLLENQDLWPTSNVQADDREVMSEIRKTPTTLNITNVSLIESVRKQYRYTTLIKITAWVRRFLRNKFAKNDSERLLGDLSSEEIAGAEYAFIRNVQKKHFPVEDRSRLSNLEIFEDSYGVLRVKTRLTYRTELEDYRFPMLLPSKGPEVLQLIRDLHYDNCHAGAGALCIILREKYWILKAKRTVKGIISKCPKCRRFAAKMATTHPAPLPLNRVKDAEVFEVVGLDAAGPLVLKNGTKIWMLIFTCGVYRAVHFELVKSLSTRAFIGALEKFVKKYRRPAVIYSDNGTNFRGANNYFNSLDWNAIKEEDNVKQIEWKFNPVISAWWGGWWERLIRTAKDLLKRTVGKGSLNWKELETILATVRDVMNNRPLTYVSENPDDLEPLTPALFLHPYGNVLFPEGGLSEANQLRYRYNYVRTLQKELKNRFLKEYLAMLVNRKPKKATTGLKVGELVLVGSDNRKRIEWPLGRVMELIPGNDGVCRLAKVKTAQGVITRTLQRLFSLEMEIQNPLGMELRRKKNTTGDEGRDADHSQIVDDDPIRVDSCISRQTTRCGRLVKPPIKFQ